MEHLLNASDQIGATEQTIHPPVVDQNNVVLVEDSTLLIPDLEPNDSPCNDQSIGSPNLVRGIEQKVAHGGYTNLCR